MSSSRETTRDMHRLASLYNGVAMVQLQAICWDVLVDARLRDDNVLEIAAQQCSKPIEITPIFGANVSEEMKKTFVSVNQCVAVLVYNFLWLAHCTSGLDIELEEYTFTEPKRVHNVELQHIGYDTLTRIDYHHTVLLLLMPDDDDEESIVADATYAQYSFDNGIDTLTDFWVMKTQQSSRAVPQSFGTCFEQSAVSEADAWEETKTRSVIRITNNVVLREMELDGGLEALLEMSAESFQEARDKIFAALRTELDSLRRRLERIKYGTDTRFFQDLEDLVQDCDGAGHQTCVLSFKPRDKMAVQLL